MSDRALYDQISCGYTAARRADPRIAARIHAALGDARRVLNVGAGTGNYEPSDRSVVAVEPSWAMIEQRADESAPVVRGVAEALPFGSGSFDVAMGVLTVHHWPDNIAGLGELRRVARRQVIMLFDPDFSEGMWLLDYFAEGLGAPSERNAIGPDVLARHLNVIDVQVVPVPHDCTDGFGYAYWARPEAYLDPEVQAGISLIAQMEPDQRAACSDRLAHDLASGTWDERYGGLRRQPETDGGYRLVVAEN
ncbi:MAG: class I SAM-dependent methyltransferase [Acidimicrobiales bacterium]